MVCSKKFRWLGGRTAHLPFPGVATVFIASRLLCTTAYRKLYPLLPVMQGASSELLSSAMEELASLYREDEVNLSKQFVWMELLLERTDTVSLPEKLEVKRRLRMYDSLWEDHPKVKQIRADSELRALRRTFMHLIKISFPELEVLAQQRVVQIQDPAMLDLLIEKVYTAPNQETVHGLLEEKEA